MIELHDVSKIYQVGGQEVRALDQASLTVREGEFVSIVGPSGSGKTTMMNIIGCLDVADSGQYILDGLPIDRYSDRELAAIRNRKIGFVFQGFNLLSRLTAEANVELPLIYQRLAMGDRKKLVNEALQRVDLYDRRKHKPQELSGGQQQRVAIARALVTRPSLLLADEPTGNLDSKTGAEIIELFHELHQSGNTILLITHNPDIAKTASRMVHIFDGKVYEEARA
ncbi:MAG TPA: ABC transporter ATP-binding protein [Bacillota bacterium]|nr:ABC transporter ATP-binding protein [Fastidiosipila sp.]HPX93318.1 ABC transporter ATP-binding protein [Bacillota bacterium]HQB80977.1 ABC transporter ATP-binding protein [Bacillota bacterium]